MPVERSKDFMAGGGSDLPDFGKGSRKCWIVIGYRQGKSKTGLEEGGFVGFRQR